MSPSIAAAVAVTVVVRFSHAWCIVPSSTSGDTMRELALVRVACCVLLISFWFQTQVLGWVGSAQDGPICHFGKIKKKIISSTILPPLLNLWRPSWHHHLKPATPPLFGGILSKIRHAILPWRRHNHHLTTLQPSLLPLQNMPPKDHYLANQFWLRWRGGKTDWWSWIQ